MTLDSFLAAFRDTDMMLPLVCSLVAGSLIGAEREINGKPAGLRTHTLVCFASALMTLAGLRTAEWMIVLPDGTQVVSDLARMPHAILTGIGFLGAGVIFREGGSVRGLTTAASLWLTAALGIVFGTGLLELGAIGTVAALVVLVALRVLQQLLPRRARVRLEIGVGADSSYDQARLTETLSNAGLQPGAVVISQDRDLGLRQYMTIASAKASHLDLESLCDAFHSDSLVRRFSINPVENDAGAGS